MPSPMVRRTQSRQSLSWARRIGYSALYGVSGLALLTLMYAALIQTNITVAHAMVFAADHGSLLAIVGLCAGIGMFLFCCPDKEFRLLERSYPQLSRTQKIFPAVLAAIQLIGVGFMLIATVIMMSLRE